MTSGNSWIPLGSLGPARAARDEPLPDRLVDQFGRVHNNLRISVTDRCNFRCIYCMPEEMEFYPDASRSSPTRRSCASPASRARLGVDKIRLTGGEPWCAGTCRSWSAALA